MPLHRASTATASPDVMRVVSHGADANVARPADTAAVYWIGTVEPLQALDGDLWIGSTA
jgi:hypothetical protein